MCEYCKRGNRSLTNRELDGALSGWLINNNLVFVVNLNALNTSPPEIHFCPYCGERLR